MTRKIDSTFRLFLVHVVEIGKLREPFYKIIQIFAPCGHIKGALLQNSQNSRRVGRVVSRRVASCRVVSRRVVSCRVGRRVFIFHNFYFCFNRRPDTPRNMRFIFAGLPQFFGPHV